MYIRYPFIFLSNNVRCISTTALLYAKNHYDVLGLTPKATQGEIKSAYYKLSKLYHPDKNLNSTDAGVKFRDITAAYEILGNVRTRKLYDKGVHVDGPAYRHPAQDDDPKTRFYRSREHRHRPPTGRTPIYDFDEWSRAHYGATFARDMDRKRREELLRKVETKNNDQVRIEKVVFTFMFFIAVLTIFFGEDHDKPRTFYNAKKIDESKTS